MRTRLLAALAGLAMLGAPLTERVWARDKGGATDGEIYDRVMMRLATDPDVKGGALDVTVKNGAVIMKGKVDTQKGKRRAETLAKKVKGVKSVENDLAVGPRIP